MSATKKMFKRKHLATDKNATIGDAAGNVAGAVVIDIVELQSMFENLFFNHFKCFSLELQSMFEHYSVIISNALAYVSYKKKMFKRKHLETDKNATVGDTARNVAGAVVIVDAVELQSMFEKLFYYYFKCLSVPARMCDLVSATKVLFLYFRL